MNDDIPEGYARVSDILAMVPSYFPDGYKGTDFKWGYPIQDIPTEILNYKKDLGTDVHAAIAADSKGEFYPLDDEAKPYFESYLKWKGAVKPIAKLVERRFNAPSLKLSGQPDMLATIAHSPLPVIIDFKNTANEDPYKWKLQAAFYALLADLNGIKCYEIASFVRLDKEGNMPKSISYLLTPDVFTAAMSAYNLFQHLHKRN